MNLQNRFLNISYSKLADIPVPFNTHELYEAACGADFDAIKGDVTPSCDARLIMCHDPYFEIDENGRVFEPGSTGVRRVMINELSGEQCMSLEYSSESYRDYLGYYAHVTDLEDLIRLCSSKDKIPYITVRDKEISSCVDEIYRLVVKYDMIDKCIINSFTKETLEAMRKKDPLIQLSLVWGPNKALTKDVVDFALSLGNCVICIFWFKEYQLSGQLYEASREAYEYGQEKGVVFHLAPSDDKESYNWAKNHGFKGAQCSKAEIISD